MFLLFDLDDTLIETSKCLTPHYLRLGLQAMMQAGLEVEDEQSAFLELQQIDANAQSANKALEIFWCQLSNCKHILDAGHLALAITLPIKKNIDPVPGSVTLLESLKKHYSLGIVTKGHREVQIEKLKKAGIDPSYFRIIIASAAPCKQASYLAAMQSLGKGLPDGVVIGDRISRDLAPAKELGLTTVHFRNGRGKNQVGPCKDVDWTIDTLGQLQEVLDLL